MNLAIIAAGESSRLKAEGLKTSKSMIRVNGECLIERIIRIARHHGANRTVCIINRREPELREFLASADFGMPLKLLVKDTTSSMHSLFALAPFLTEAPFCLAATDSVFRETEFAGFISFSLRQKNLDGVLAVTSFIDDEKPLCVSLDDEKRILAFSDSPEGAGWATGGIYYLSPRIFDLMEKARQKGISRLRNYFKVLVSEGYVFKGFAFSKIIDLDRPSDIREAERFLSHEDRG